MTGESEISGAGGVLGWVRAADAAARLRFALWRALRREDSALIQLGRGIAALPDPTLHPTAAEALAAVRERMRSQEMLGASLLASLDDDRADYRLASPLGRALVILRGLCARAVLRDRIRLGRRALRPLLRNLGFRTMEMPHAAGLLPGLGRDIASLRADADIARRELAAWLEPFQGALLPASFRRLVREVRHFGRSAMAELRGRLLPRAPALAGLLAGLWIADTFTDSTFSATLHRIGIGSGPTRAVSAETLQTMSFWLPLLAAAVCGYGCDRLRALFRRRYHSGAEVTGPGPAAPELAPAGGGTRREEI